MRTAAEDRVLEAEFDRLQALVPLTKPPKSPWFSDDEIDPNAPASVPTTDEE